MSLLQPARDEDWPDILALANLAAPGTAAANAVWLENRRRFDETRFARRHHLARDEDGTILAYGAIEGGDEPGRFRLFLVAEPATLETDVAAHLFDRLTVDLGELRATAVWMREETRDTDLLGFVGRRGFVETQRFIAHGPDAGASEGIELVVLEQQLWEGA